MKGAPVTVRLDPETLDAVEGLARQTYGEDWPRGARSDVLRRLIHLGLREVERRGLPTPGDLEGRS